MSEEQQMRKVVFAINITIDGYCGHETGIADDELHEYFAKLLQDSDVDIFGRNTYHLMYPYWHDVAVNQSETNTINEFAAKAREQLTFMDYVPVIFISAKTHQRIHQVLPTALRVVGERRHRLSTAEINEVVREAYDATQVPSRMGRPLRIYYATQVGNDPPTFVFFVNDVELIHFSYERYLENRIRAYYPFEGTPIKLIFRARRNEDE